MGTLNRADLGLGPTNTPAQPDRISLDGSQPGAVAPVAGRLADASAAPAVSWVGMVILLVVLAVVYKLGRR